MDEFTEFYDIKLTRSRNLGETTTTTTSRTSSCITTLLHDLRNFCISNEIGLILNQKVVAPSIFNYFKSEGILIIERLGQKLMKRFSQFLFANSRGSVITSLVNLSSNDIGLLHSLEKVEIDSHVYLRSQTDPESNCYTISIANLNEDSTQDLKVKFYKTHQCF